jgi:hypothetical protein
MLYWERNGPADRAPEQVVELLGREALPVTAGKLQSYHGAGLYPAPLWPEGQLLADRVGVRLEESMLVPAAVRIFVGVAGEPERALVGRVKVVPDSWPEAGPPVAELEPGVAIADLEITPEPALPGATVQLSLTWIVTAPPERALTAFVHLGEPGEPPLASGDSPPLNGHYPTDVWAAGEVIPDQYSLAVPADLAPGMYPLLVGLYDPVGGSRLPLTIAGERQPHDSLIAGYVRVVANGE